MPFAPPFTVLRPLALAFACTTCVVTPALAFDSPKIVVPKAAKALKSDLGDALLLKTLDDEAKADTATVLATAQADYRQILDALYARGYYAASISIKIDGREAAEIAPFSPPETIDTITITVDPGPQFTFGEVAIGPLARATVLPDGLHTGAVAEADKVRDGVRAAVQKWREQGNAKARVASQQISARHAERQLDVDVAITPGPELRFGEVTVSGDSAVRAPRVRQIAGIPRGERFDPRHVQKAASRLRAAGPFGAVTITEAETPNPDGTLDMDLSVTDRAPRRIGAGIEVSSTEGVSLNGYWMHRNIFGGGETLRLDGEVNQLGSPNSEFDWSLSARIEKPAVYGADTRGYGMLSFEETDEEDFIERSASVGIGASREFTDELTGDLSIVLSTSRVTDKYLDGNPTRRYNLLSFPGELTLDHRDVAANPRKGSYYELGATPFTFLSQDGAGGQLTFEARGYQPLGDRVVMAGRFKLGALAGTDAQDAPPDLLFYSGGSSTVRGQPYQSLGATYGDDDLGGLSLAALSLEARVGVTDQIGVVGFVDAAQVGSDPMPLTEGDWHAGAGLGLRYDTSIGPIRLDLAGPVAGDTGKGLHIYLGIGQAF